MIRILIQRVIAPGVEPNYDELIRTTMQAAVAAPGFISGEAMHDIQHPNVRYVLVKMNTEEDWHNWYQSPERTEATNLLAPLLMEPERITLLGH